MDAATLVARARKVGQTAQAAAWAIELVTGRSAASLCVWCAEAIDPGHQGESFRLVGDCSACSYSGRDCIVLVSPTCSTVHVGRSDATP